MNMWTMVIYCAYVWLSMYTLDLCSEPCWRFQLFWHGGLRLNADSLLCMDPERPWDSDWFILLEAKWRRGWLCHQNLSEDFEILNPSTTKNEQIQTKLSMKFCWWETVMTRRLFSAIYHMYPNSHTPRPPVVNLRFTVRSFLQLGPNIMIFLVLVGTCS